MSVPSKSTLPSIRTPSMRSFMRFRQRRRVDLPQPEGPMRAVTRRGRKSIVIPWSACFSP